MSERTIVSRFGKDNSITLTDQDAQFLGLKPGDNLVLQVRQTGVGNTRSFQATLSVAEGDGKGAPKTPRAFR